MSSATQREIVVREVVRGARPWGDLRSEGIAIELGATSVRVLEGLTPPVHVTPEDVATGLLTYAFDSDRLRDWARVVHGSIGLIELDLEDHPEGDHLLDALWRLSFGEELTADMLSAARRTATS